MQPTLVTDPTKQPREENTLSIIYTSVPDTQRGNKKKTAAKGRTFLFCCSVFVFLYKTGEQTETCSEESFFPCAAGMKT